MNRTRLSLFRPAMSAGRQPARAPKENPMPRPSHLARPGAAALLALAALLAACTSYDPRTGDGPPPTGAPTATPIATPTTAPTAEPTPASIGSAHVVLTTATAHAVTVDVTDGSGTLTAAATGTPGDGASVEAYKLHVKNLSPTSLRLTWVGGPCSSANTLSIDASRHQLLLVQPECPGDAIATDRILDLEFSTAIDAAGIEAFLQDGLDT